MAQSTTPTRARRAAPPGPSARIDRRQQLIDATVSTIAAHGLSRTTLARVGDVARLSPGIVSFYFENKDALLLATLRHLAEEFEAALEAAIARAGATPAAALDALIEACFDPAISDVRKVAVWYAFWGESRARAEYLEVCGDKERAYHDAILVLCRQLIDEGALAHLDAEAVTRGLIGIIDGLWQDLLSAPDDFDRARAKHLCHAYLAGLFPSAAGVSYISESAAGPAERSAAVPLTLPAWTYDHAEFHALELDHLLLPSWQIVCHESEIPRSGDYATLELFGERVAVVRDQNGAVRAFQNVCRHRAHAVVEGASGHCERFLQCPYHGWAYNFDGSLRAVPSESTFPALDKSSIALPPVAVELFHGFVFVRLAGNGPSVAERLAPYTDELADYRLERMQPAGMSWTQDVAIDWKNVMDNYLEDYHFITAHPGLAGLMNPDYEREVRVEAGTCRLSHCLRAEPAGRWSERHYHRVLPNQDHLPPELRRRWSYFSLFPSVNFDLYPERMDWFQIMPLGPGRCRLRARAYALPDDRRETRIARYLGRRINARVQAEDNRLTRSVQQGLASRGYTTGFLSAKEVAVHGFQEWIRRTVPVARLPAAPPAGTLALRNAELLRQNQGTT